MIRRTCLCTTRSYRLTDGFRRLASSAGGRSRNTKIQRKHNMYRNAAPCNAGRRRGADHRTRSGNKGV